MSNADIIIIGAGAAGLVAGRELSKAGKKVLLLEAQNRIGGRIHTITVPGFSMHLEAGAEFIHGEMPVTQALLNEAGIPYFKNEGNYYNIRNGKFLEPEDNDSDFSILYKKAASLKNDLPFAEFLHQ